MSWRSLYAFCIWLFVSVFSRKKNFFFKFNSLFSLKCFSCYICAKILFCFFLVFFNFWYFFLPFRTIYRFQQISKNCSKYSRFTALLYYCVDLAQVAREDLISKKKHNKTVNTAKKTHHNQKKQEKFLDSVFYQRVFSVVFLVDRARGVGTSFRSVIFLGDRSKKKRPNVKTYSCYRSGVDSHYMEPEFDGRNRNKISLSSEEWMGIFVVF